MPSGGSLGSGTLIALAVLASSAQAWADDGSLPERPAPTVVSAWSTGADRFFASGMIDIGPLYLRPRLSAGFGRPFWRWTGVDVNPIVSGEGVGAYGGLRATVPNFDLRVGSRYFFAFYRHFLEPREQYDVLALERRTGPSSRYLSLEAELTASVPMGPGRALTVLSATYVMLVPDDYWVFEETLRVVADPPWIWLARTGYELPVGELRIVRVGAVVEAAGSPDRGAWTVRCGVTGSMRLWKTVELRGAIVPAVYGEDSLGAAGGQWFELGVRLRFATGAGPS